MEIDDRAIEYIANLIYTRDTLKNGYISPAWWLGTDEKYKQKFLKLARETVKKWWDDEMQAKTSRDASFEEAVRKGSEWKEKNEMKLNWLREWKTKRNVYCPNCSGQRYSMPEASLSMLDPDKSYMSFKCIDCGHQWKVWYAGSHDGVDW